MSVHELKTWPEYFEAMWSGSKTFELRRDDRDFQIGHLLYLREWAPCEACKGAKRIAVNQASGVQDLIDCMRCRGRGTVHGDGYTGREMTAVVTYVLRGPAFGLLAGWAILGVKAKQRAGSSARLPSQK